MNNFNELHTAEEKNLFSNAPFDTGAEVEFGVFIAWIGGDVELVHLDQVQTVDVAATYSSCFENSRFHGKRNRIVAQDEEPWIV